MAKGEMLTVFSYDIADDRRRRKIAKLLEERMVRVQESVFEARLTKAATTRLVKRLEVHLTIDDSLRVYAVAADGLARCHQHGGAPMMGDEDYWLL